MRKDNRQADQLREFRIIPGFINRVPGSAYVEHGSTRIIATAIFENKIPSFLRGKKKGWINAEYAMLPGSSGIQRQQRERMKVNHRNIEIQRFIGRSLRNVFDLKAIDGKTIHIDTDVIQADGGTRCACINGGMVALVQMLRYMVYENHIPAFPEIEYIAAVSVGIKDGEVLVDLNYEEDVAVDADINIVSSEKGNVIQVQGFAEETPVPYELFRKATELGIEKNLEIITKLKALED